MCYIMLAEVGVKLTTVKFLIISLRVVSLTHTKNVFVNSIFSSRALQPTPAGLSNLEGYIFIIYSWPYNCLCYN